MGSRARPTDYPFEVGGDAKFGLTPSLTLDLTYNTDFAQVEVDEVRSNLTRFPLFFPEKRPFFLENAGVFSAGTPQAVDLFFSRRIGINDSGQTVPIIGGGRLTGKVAGVTVGVLQLFTDDVEPVSVGNSYTVARATREIGAPLAGGRHLRAADGHRRTAGTTTRPTGSTAGSVSAMPGPWTGGEPRPRLRGSRAATPRLPCESASRTPSGTTVSATCRWARISIPRSDSSPARAIASWKGRSSGRSARPASPWMRQWNPAHHVREWRGFDWEHQSSYYHLDPEFDFTGGGRLGPELDIQGETLVEPFEIAEGVVLQPGRYDWVFNAWDFDTNPSAPFSIVSRLELGGFYSGTKYGGGRHLHAAAERRLHQFAAGGLPGCEPRRGRLHPLRPRASSWATSSRPRISIQSLVQYSNQAQVWTANARFAWLNTAGTGLFVVFNDAEEAEGIGVVDPAPGAVT